MDQAQYEALCQRAEALAVENPSRYRWKLRAFSWLGHIVLLGLLALLIAILVGIVAAGFYWTGLFVLLVKKKVGLLVLPVIWVILTALWVKFDKPSGFELKRDEFPELFTVIDELQAELKTPAIHQVLLTSEFNASVSQTPRLGVFGWQFNTLTLGLTLLMTLNPEQARSVIAHELGHLSASHSAFAARIYRSRISWQRVMVAFHDNQTWGGHLVRVFFDWYSPRFSAYSFALARQNEYEADSIAATLTSPEDAGNALVAVHTLHSRVDNEYWQSIYKTADHLEQPNAQPWKFLKNHIAAERKKDLSEDLQIAMSYTSSYSDTHPSLEQRLQNIGVEPAIINNMTLSASEAWFGDESDAVLTKFDEQWTETNREPWGARYQYVQEAKRKISDYEAHSSADLAQEDMWEKINLWNEFKSEDEFLELINVFLSKHPDDPKLCFTRAQVLAERRDEACLQDLSIAANDPDIALDVCTLAYYFLLAQDREQDAQVWLEKANAIEQERKELNEAMYGLRPNDKMRKSQLSSENREAIIDALKSSGLVKKAWIAEKVVSEEISPPVALAVTAKKLFLWDETSYLQELNAHLPDMITWTLVNRGEEKEFADKVVKVKDRLF